MGRRLGTCINFVGGPVIEGQLGLGSGVVLGVEIGNGKFRRTSNEASSKLSRTLKIQKIPEIPKIRKILKIPEVRKIPKTPKSRQFGKSQKPEN